MSMAGWSPSIREASRTSKGRKKSEPPPGVGPVFLGVLEMALTRAGAMPEAEITWTGVAAPRGHATARRRLDHPRHARMPSAPQPPERHTPDRSGQWANRRPPLSVSKGLAEADSEEMTEQIQRASAKMS